MNSKVVFVFLVIIFSLKFFDANLVLQGPIKYLCFAFMLATVVMSLPHFTKYSGGFVFPIQLISVSIFIAIIMGQYTWGQSIAQSATTIPYLMWFSFFYFLSTKIPIIKIENIVLIYGLIYIALFLFQFTHSGVVYFGGREEFVKDRGIIRINFPGAGVFFLSCFIAVNRITRSDKFKWAWVAYAIAGIIVTVLQVTRQSIFLLLLFYMIHFLRNVKLPYKIVTVIIFSLGTYLFLNSGSSISEGLAQQQKEDSSAGSDYIRILSAEYYLTQFTPNTISKIFGNGFANDTSTYGKVQEYLSLQYGFFLSDVGLVEVYICFGIFAIIGYFMIFIKSITIKIPPDYYYLKYYLWLIFLTSLTSDLLISSSFLITTVLVLYCYQLLYIQNKYQLVLTTPSSAQ